MQSVQTHMNFVEVFFNEFANKSGLTYDQAKFVVSLFLCYPFGHIFRIVFAIRRCSAQQRHCLSMLCGAGILSFCFGRQALHLLVSSLLGYMLMACIDYQVVHRYIFLVAMTYLSVVHIHRMFQHEGYVIDISGPLMLTTVKITYVGFDIHDAFSLQLKKKDDTINKDNKDVIYQRPTLLEYFSYIFSFMTVMCGPVPQYKDYKEMIEETQYYCTDQKKEISKTPSPFFASLCKWLFSYFMVFMYTVMIIRYPPEKLGCMIRLAEANILESMFFAEMVIYLAKTKYYAPFLTGEAICNATGLGFNGYDETNKNVQWDKLTNMKPAGMETARSIREMVESWNVQTNIWLKKCIYNRAPQYPLLCTWFFSALWHGFYPGYYMFFVPLGLGLYVARKMRRKVRPYFLHSTTSKLLYDLVTLIATRLIINFYAAAFTMMDMKATLRFWRGAYFYGHWMLLVGLIVVTILPDDVNKPVVSSNGYMNGEMKKSKKVS